MRVFAYTFVQTTKNGKEKNRKQLSHQIFQSQWGFLLTANDVTRAEFLENNVFL